MKKSEMLILIANQLDYINGNFNGYKTQFTPQQLSKADIILSAIEASGMMPPLREEQIMFDNEQYTSYAYKWEPEDENKN